MPNHLSIRSENLSEKLDFYQVFFLFSLITQFKEITFHFTTLPSNLIYKKLLAIIAAFDRKMNAVNNIYVKIEILHNA